MKAWDSQHCARMGKKEMQNSLYPDLLLNSVLLCRTPTPQSLGSPSPALPIFLIPQLHENERPHILKIQQDKGQKYSYQYFIRTPRLRKPKGGTWGWETPVWSGPCFSIHLKSSSGSNLLENCGISSSRRSVRSWLYFPGIILPLFSPLPFYKSFIWFKM